MQLPRLRQDALEVAGLLDDPFAQNFAFVHGDEEPTAQPAAAEPTAAEAAVQRQRFSHVARRLTGLRMVYKAKHPMLRLILSEQCVDEYSRVHGRLLRNRYIQYALRQLWRTLQNRAWRRPRDSRLLKVALLRHEMQLLVDTLGRHFVNQVRAPLSIARARPRPPARS